jgi:hypothetical protein
MPQAGLGNLSRLAHAPGSTAPVGEKREGVTARIGCNRFC